MTVRKLKLLVLIFFSLAINLSFADAFENEGVNKQFKFGVDLEANGQIDDVTLRISGSSINSPLTWLLTVTRKNGQTIFSTKRDDQWLDTFFGEKGYVDNCSDYEACKKRYYFELLPQKIKMSLAKSTQPVNVDKYFLNNLHETAKIFLTDKGFSQTKIDQIILEMTTMIKADSFILLEIPISPVQDDSPMIWVKSVNLFVPYYTN